MEPGRLPPGEWTAEELNYSIATRIMIMIIIKILHVPQCAMQEFVIVQPSYPGSRVWAIAVLPPV